MMKLLFAAFALAMLASACSGGGSKPLATAKAAASEVGVGTPNVPPPVTPLTLADIGTGKTVGGMRVLPPGSVPSFWEARQGPDEIRSGVQGLDSPAARTLTLHRVTAPRGFALTDGGFTTAVAANGEVRTLQEFYALGSPDQWPVDIEIIRIAAGAQSEVIAWYGDTGRTFGIYQHAGVDAIVSYGTPDAKLQAVLEAHFVIGDWYFHVRAPGLPAGILIDIVNSLVEDNR